MQRPFVGAADHDRRDACRLERLHRRKQIVPGLDGGRIDIGLRHQLLVVEEADLRQRRRQAVDAAVLAEGRQRSRGQRVGIALHLVGDVIEDAGLDLRLQDAAGPAVDDVGTVLGLQDGRQLGLEGLIFEELHLDLGAGMRRLVAARDLLPDLDLCGIGLDVQPFHRGVGAGSAGYKQPCGNGESQLAEQPHQQSSRRFWFCLCS